MTLVLEMDSVKMEKMIFRFFFLLSIKNEFFFVKRHRAHEDTRSTSHYSPSNTVIFQRIRIGHIECIRIMIPVRMFLFLVIMA